MVDERFRLSDAELQRFLVDGYLVLRPEFPDGFHGRVYDRIGTVMEQVGNPFNNILPLVPELGSVFGHPRVAGTLASILGDDYYLNMHRHCHDRAPGGGAQRLHKDSLYNSRYAVDGNRRHHHARWVMAFYYPQDTGEDMGPTAIVPRSQYLLEQQREEDEIHLTGAAGTVVIVHYDIWHRAAGTVSAARKPLHGEVPVHPHERSPRAELAPRPRRGSARSGTATAWTMAAAPGRAPDCPRCGATSGAGTWASPGPAPDRRHRRMAAWPRCSRSWPTKTSTRRWRRPIASAAVAGMPRDRWPRRCAAPTNASRRNAACGFAPLGAAAVPALSDLAGDADPAVRARAVDALGDVGPPARAAAATLAAALADDEEVVREHAADALGLVCGGAGEAASAAAALAAVMQDGNDTVRRNAALSLARIGAGAAGAADQVAGALVAGLEDESLYVNGYSVLGLRRLATPRAHRELLARLEEARWEPRETAPAGLRREARAGKQT